MNKLGVQHICDTPNYTDGPCEGCARDKLAASLLPCPFCGSTNLELDNLGDGDDWFVNCLDCEVQQIARYAPTEAVERWNRRTQPASRPSERDREDSAKAQAWEEAARMAERFADASEDGPAVCVARAISAECKRRTYAVSSPQPEPPLNPYDLAGMHKAARKRKSAPQPEAEKEKAQ